MSLAIQVFSICSFLRGIAEVSCIHAGGVKCLPWEIPEHNGTYCTCRNDLPLGVHCNQGDLYVDGNKCLAYTNGTLFESSCPYQRYKHISIAMLKVTRNLSEINQFFCNDLGRTGFFCEECKKYTGISVLTGSYKCSECNNMWRNLLIYISLTFLPITVFFIILVLLQLPITSPSLKMYIFYSQGITIIFGYDVIVWNKVRAHCSAPMLTIFNVLLTLYEPWNLDFFKHVTKDYCLSEHLNGIHVNVLSFMQPLYVLLLIILLHLSYKLNNYTINYAAFEKLIRLFSRCASILKLKNAKSSLIDGIIGFYFLCSLKLVLCSLLVFRNTHIQNVSKIPPEVVIEVVYIEPSLPYLGRQHIPYVILSSAVLGLLLLFLLFLTCYTLPFFRRELNRCGSYSFMQYIHILADKLYGLYKDGTDNRQDLRIFSMFPFILQVVILIIPVFHIPHTIIYTARGVIFLFSGILILIIRPYKVEWHNIVDAVWLSYLGLQCILINILLYSAFINTLSCIWVIMVSMVLPLLAILLIVIFKVIMLSKNIFSPFENQQRQENSVDISNNTQNGQEYAEIDHERKPLLERT